MDTSHQVRVSRSRPPAIQAPLSKAMPLLLLVVVLTSSLTACSWFRDRRLAQQKAVAEQQRRRLEAQCRRDRQRLQPLIDAFRRSEERVAAIEAEGYVASAAPAPLDPDEQRRLAVYDQEIEQEQYDQSYAAWQEREAQRRAAWRSDRRARLAQARERRAEAASAVRAKVPALVSAADPPQLNQAEVQRRLSCGARPR